MTSHLCRQTDRDGDDISDKCRILTTQPTRFHIYPVSLTNTKCKWLNSRSQLLTNIYIIDDIQKPSNAGIVWQEKLLRYLHPRFKRDRQTRLDQAGNQV